MRDLWYKDAVIYCLDVETFQDDDGDGIGDFKGLTRRLDHLAGLGVTCLWLLPFYPTPNRDNGYDIIDYYGVDPRLGTLGEFVEFMYEARERGIRVIADLVVNHTSAEHPWFQEARDPSSDKHDWYVWSDERPEDSSNQVIFPGVQEEIWTYDQKAKQYYLHRFYDHQPDLNIANPAVREEICRIMGFWLELGISGFRMDAAPYMIELKGIEEQTDVAAPYEYLREFRDFLQWRRGDAILLAEANVTKEYVSEYFGDGKRMHMLFNFILNQHLYLAFARRKAEPLKVGLRLPPDPPEDGQWAHFLRNHDELNLGQLDKDQQQEVFDAFAPDEDMRLYERGIRRRLPPMLDGDERRIRMAYSLLLTLPGTPVLRYGQEIGMGEDLSLEERRSVRTVMQWSDDENGGFSKADPDELARPVLREGPHGYEQVNVSDQRNDPESRLNWMERMIRLRKKHHAVGWGEWAILDTGHEAVLAHACRHRSSSLIAVHNLDEEECTVRLDLSDEPKGRVADLLGERHYHEISDDTTLEVDLNPFGYRWFHIDGET